MIPLANLAQVYAPSLVMRASPITPTPPGPPLFLMAARNPSATTSRASCHDTVTNWPDLRTIGSAGRASLLTDSKAQRPFLPSQPWFTGAASMPSRRVTRLEEDCTATRHPTEQVVQVDSTWSRSQGRAENRYG